MNRNTTTARWDTLCVCLVRVFSVRCRLRCRVVPVPVVVEVVAAYRPPSVRRWLLLLMTTTGCVAPGPDPVAGIQTRAGAIHHGGGGGGEAPTRPAERRASRPLSEPVATIVPDRVHTTFTRARAPYAPKIDPRRASPSFFSYHRVAPPYNPMFRSIHTNFYKVSGVFTTAVSFFSCPPTCCYTGMSYKF